MSRFHAGRVVGPLVLLLIALAIGLQLRKPGAPAIHPAAAGSLGLITEPNAGIAPELALINNAHQSVDMTMYELEDPVVEQALAAAEGRGVAVRVLLNQGYYGKQSSANQTAYQFLKDNHVPVRWTPGYFALTHQKTLTVDGKTASIMSFNFTPRYYSADRDFAISDTDINDVKAIETAFNNDWGDKQAAAPNGDDLIWSPGSEPALVNLIASANHSLDIYNEEMNDTKVEQALEQAAQRGVNVEIVMTDASEWHGAFRQLSTDGVHIHTFAASAPLYIHAKMILADSHQGFVGSENFSTTSLDKNRELGIIFNDPNIINSLNGTFSADYQAATPFQ